MINICSDYASESDLVFIAKKRLYVLLLISQDLPYQTYLSIIILSSLLITWFLLHSWL